VLQTSAQGGATRGLTIRHNPAHSLQAQRQTLRNRHRGFHTIAAVAITHTETQGYAPIPAHPKTEDHLFDLVTSIFAMLIGGMPLASAVVLIGANERKSSGILREPWRWNGINLQGFEDDRPQHCVEMGGKKRVEDVPEAVIVDRGPR
jgi:hypothetical protein